ncbi:MAG: hypothetical protein SFY69_02485 [Planctomycetota bacterium]|nr:hypothetical protein [Planctomycetota bacterium]
MPDAPSQHRARRAWRIAGALAGLALLAAAVRAVWMNAAAFDAVRGALADAPAWRIALLGLLPVVSWMLTSGVFTALTTARHPVRTRYMAALVGASWLLNYLPFSPGLLARVAYQKRVLEIPVRTSARIVAESIVLGLAGGCVLLGELAWLPRTWMLRGGGIGGLSLGVLAGVLLAGALRGRVPVLGAAYGVALLLKYADTLAWSLRYWTIFALLGVPISATQAVAIALVAQVSMLVPGLANGLGVREWTVGLLAGALPAWMAWGAGASPDVAVALSADLSLRALEVGAAVVVGAACAWRLARGRTRFAPRS